MYHLKLVKVHITWSKHYNYKNNNIYFYKKKNKEKSSLLLSDSQKVERIKFLSISRTNQNVVRVELFSVKASLFSWPFSYIEERCGAWLGKMFQPFVFFWLYGMTNTLHIWMFPKWLCHYLGSYSMGKMNQIGKVEYLTFWHEVGPFKRRRDKIKLNPLNSFNLLKFRQVKNPPIY